jgi:Flp pilus assembly protein TadG
MTRPGLPRPLVQPSHRLSGDQGTVLVELAFIAPFLVLLALGILEFGTAFREKSNLSAALQSSARIEAGTGAGRLADYYALQSFYALTRQSSNVTVNKVVIYRTTAAGGAPLDPTCFTLATGSSAFNCSVYTWTQITQIGQDPAGGPISTTDFGTSGSTCAATAWDVNWCPLNRKVDQADPPDYVGVYVNATYKSQTGLLPTTVTMTDRAIYRIDPKVTTS